MKISRYLLVTAGIPFLLSLGGCDVDPVGASTPASMIVSKITVSGFPSTKDDGSNWDPFDNLPDLYVVIKYASQEILNTSNNHFSNCQNDVSYDFTNGMPIVLQHPDQRHTISLYDYDPLDSDDFVGGYDFTPWSGSEDETVELVLPDSETHITLHVTYQ